MVFSFIAKFALPLRIAEIVLGFLVLALMAAFTHNVGGVRNEPAFLLFCGVWGIVMGIVMIFASKQEDTNSVYIAAAIDFVSCVFYFAGWIAAASVTYDCEVDVRGVDLGDYRTYCRVFNAAVAMGAFAWLVWTITCLITIPKAIAASKGSSSSSGSNNQQPSNA